MKRLNTGTVFRFVFLALGCGLFAYLLARLDARLIFQLLLEIGWNLLWIAAAFACHQLIRTFALWLCVTTYDQFRYWELVKIRVSGEAIQFLTSTGPFLAEPAKALLLKQAGLPVTHAAASIVCEYLVYTISSAMMALWAMIYMLRFIYLPPALETGVRVVLWICAIFLGTSAVAIAGRHYLIGSIVNWFTGLPGIGKRLHVNRAGLRTTEDLLFQVLRTRRLVAVLATEFLGQAALILELFLLLTAANQTFRFIDLIVIEASTKFLTFGVFFIPGQIGASEAVYAVVFDALGLSASAGVSLALARRLRSLLISGVGLGFLAVYRRIHGEPREAARHQPS